MSKRYLVKKDEGLQNKLFHDILKGLKYRGYDMLVVGKDIFIPLKRESSQIGKLLEQKLLHLRKKTDSLLSRTWTV